MAFDGITVAALTKEFRDQLLGGYIQKIAQPEQDELILTIKNNRKNHKLLISASASLPLIHLTSQNKMSPLTAPNFCMLLRKHLSSARILDIKQPSLERIIEFHLENLNELGDLVQRRLIVELMGKHSNIILVDQDGQIMDAIKHINGLMSSVREVLPGRTYFVPNTRNKLNPFEADVSVWNRDIFPKPMPLAKAIYSSLTGFSSTTSHEIAYRAKLDGDQPTAALNGNQHSALLDQFRNLMDLIQKGDFSPCI
ncbi:MAG: NFACT family protein, partial [Eubacterium sp.]|nr:NFACT family protein [Eubacterium sp.]